MGSIAARHARAVLEGVERILAIELVVAAQALDLRLARGGRGDRRRPGPGVAEAHGAGPGAGRHLDRGSRARARPRRGDRRSSTTARSPTWPADRPAPGVSREPKRAAVAWVGRGSLGPPDTRRGAASRRSPRDSGRPSRRSLEPLEVARVHARDLADRPADVAPEVEDAARGPPGRRPGAAGAVVAPSRQRFAVSTGGAVRRPRAVAPVAGPGTGRSVADAGPGGPPVGGPDRVEGDVDPGHLDGRGLAGEVRDGSAGPSSGRRHRSRHRRRHRRPRGCGTGRRRAPCAIRSTRCTGDGRRSSVPGPWYGAGLARAFRARAVDCAP